MAKNTYKQDEVLEEPFDIRHLLRASSYIKKYAGRMVVAILLSGHRRRVRLRCADDYPAGTGPCDSGQK